MADKPVLHVKIISPQQLLFEAEASSVSSKNAQGNFDVLPQHANFITMIENSPIIVRFPEHDKKPQVFNYPLAIVLVRDNLVSIYTYIQPNLEKK